MAGLLETYWNALQEALKNKNDAYNDLKDFEVNKYIPAENWWNQVNDGNHPVEREAYVNTWNSTYSTWAAKSTFYESKKAAYNQALKDYETAKKDLATPQELEAAAVIEQAQANLIAAQTEAQQQTTQAKMSAEEQAALRKKIINYVITGVIAIAVIGIGVWAYRKYFKKS